MWRVTGMIDVRFLFCFCFSFLLDVRKLIIIFVGGWWLNLVEPGHMKLYRSPFLRDFWHLNVAMMTSNNALIPDPDKEDILASKPTDWPWMHLGLRMCGWGDNQTKYYLLGTPIIWWGGSVSLILAICAFGMYLLRQQRKYIDMDPSGCPFVYLLVVSVVDQCGRL